MWVMRTFTESQAIVERRVEDNRWEHVVDHPLEQLMDRPNDAYDGDALWKGTCLSYVMDGNAYWLKVRNRFGDVMQLWYLPHWLVQPAYPADGRFFITHYNYSPGFASPGTDPVPISRGTSCISGSASTRRIRGSACRRSIHCCAKSRSTTRRRGSRKRSSKTWACRVWCSRRRTTRLRLTPEQIEKMKAYVANSFTRANRGKALVMGSPTDVHQFGFDSNQLQVSATRATSAKSACVRCSGFPRRSSGLGQGFNRRKSAQRCANFGDWRGCSAWTRCKTRSASRRPRNSCPISTRNSVVSRPVRRLGRLVIPRG
jgi:hypothetical protein